MHVKFTLYCVKIDKRFVDSFVQQTMKCYIIVITNGCAERGALKTPRNINVFKVHSSIWIKSTEQESTEWQNSTFMYLIIYATADKGPKNIWVRRGWVGVRGIFLVILQCEFWRNESIRIPDPSLDPRMQISYLFSTMELLST